MRRNRNQVKWHLINKKSAVYKHNSKKPKIELIVNPPSKGKKTLEKIDNRYIDEYSQTHSKMLINIRCNPLRKERRPTKCEVEMETETQLRERAGLEKKLVIKERKNSMFIIDNVVRGMRVIAKAKFNDGPKEEARARIENKKEEIIKRLVVEFE